MNQSTLTWIAIVIGALTLAALFAHHAWLLMPLLHLRTLLVGVLPLAAFWGFAARSLPAGLPPCERGAFAAFLALVFACGAVGFLLLWQVAWQAIGWKASIHVSGVGLFTVTAIFIVLDRKGWEKRLTTGAAWIKQQASALSLSAEGGLITAGLLLLLAGALLPVLWYDAHAYHFPTAMAFLERGSDSIFQHNVYAAFPMNVELLFLWPLFVESTAGCSVITLLYALIALLATRALAQRWGLSEGANLAVLLLLSTGLLHRLVIQAKNGLALMAATLVILLAYERLRESGRRFDAILMAAAMGFALGAKYVAAVSLLLPLLAVFALDLLLDRDWRRARTLLAVLVGGALLVSPWLLKNLWVHGNPVYPLLTPLLGGEPPLFAPVFAAAHAPPAETMGERLLALVQVPYDKLIANWQAMAFSPAVLLALPFVPRLVRHRGLLRALVFVAVGFLAWLYLTQRNDRFLATLVPLLALLPAAAVAQCPADGGRRVMRGLLTALAALQLYAIGAAVLRDAESVSYLLTPTFEDTYLAERMPHYRAIEWLNQQRAHDELVAQVLFIGEAQSYGAEFEAIAPSVFNQHPVQEGVPTTVSHILWNRSELNRLHRGYGPLGWPLGPELAAWMETAIEAGLVSAVYEAVPEQPGLVTVYQIHHLASK